MDRSPEQLDARTQARELALKLLYVTDLSKPDQRDQQVTDILDEDNSGVAVCDLANEITKGVLDSRDELDGFIQDAAVNWQVSRMPVIDRAVLRIGTFELVYMHDVPPRVTINEAVEIAKKYSTEKSGAFVNGVLDKVFQTHCPEKV